MSLGPDGFVILFLSTLLPFSGTVNLSVNQALSIDKEMKKPFPLAPHFSAIIPCKHLDSVSLDGAYLQGANLSGAELSRANLEGTNLYHANLSGTNLWEASLTGADLTGANLTGADLREANLKGVTGITVESLKKQTTLLKDAIMPDGSIHP